MLPAAVNEAGSWSRKPRPVIGRLILPRDSVVMATAGASARLLAGASWGSELSGSMTGIPAGIPGVSAGAITIGGGSRGTTGVISGGVTELFQEPVEWLLAG